MEKKENDEAINLVFQHIDMFLGTPEDTKKEIIGMIVAVLIFVPFFVMLFTGVI